MIPSPRKTGLNGQECCPSVGLPQIRETTSGRRAGGGRHVRQLGFRDQAGARRGNPRSGHRGTRRPHLPDHQLRVPRHRARGRAVRPRRARQHLHPDHEPHPGRVRGPRRRARGRRGGARHRQRAGRADHRPPQPGGGWRPHRVVGVALRRHLQPAALHVPQARHRGVVHRRPRRPRRLARRDPAEHPRLLRREHRQPEGRRARLRGHRRGRARRRHPARDRQHPGVALPHAAAAMGRRHHHPLGHQVHRRPRHLDRRHHRRRRQVRLRGERALRQLHRARPELPRPGLLRAARAAAARAVHPQGAPAVHARPRARRCRPSTPSSSSRASRP